jgi:predicted DsbA family dithiol-disulfide isomerase
MERRYGARIEWRPFDLHPEYPPEGIPRSELVRQYGTAFSDRLTEMFSEAGLPVAPVIERVPNSQRALRLAELARDRGRYDELHPRLFDAYWARGLDIGDEAVLLAEGAAVGLDESEMLAAMTSEEYASRIAEQTEAVTNLGAGGVPAWVIDERLLVPGAQPHEVFDRVFERLQYPPTGEQSAAD